MYCGNLLASVIASGIAARATQNIKGKLVLRKPANIFDEQGALGKLIRDTTCSTRRNPASLRNFNSESVIGKIFSSGRPPPTMPASADFFFGRAIGWACAYASACGVPIEFSTKMFFDCPVVFAGGR